MHRRKSFDSSDSSDSSDSDHNYGHSKVKKDKKDKKEKKEKKDKHDKKDKSDKKDKVKSDKPATQPAFPQPPQAGVSYSQQPPSSSSHQPTPAPPMSFGFDDNDANFPQAHRAHHAPSYGQPAPPPSGYRIPLGPDALFPDGNQAGWPPVYDADGSSPIFIGSALFENSVHPCKIGPHLNPRAMVPYGGKEHPHSGRYDLLPFIPEQMEWVPTSHGQIPHGRRPIEGGYEENGGKLYHGLANVQGVRVPGKTGEHLRGCNVSFGGKELSFQDNYEILCWK